MCHNNAYLNAQVVSPNAQHNTNHKEIIHGVNTTQYSAHQQIQAKVVYKSSTQNKSQGDHLHNDVNFYQQENEAGGGVQMSRGIVPINTT